MTTDNPLLEYSFRVPFDRIEAAHVEPAIAELLRISRARLAAIGQDGGASRTFDNTMRQLDELGEPLDFAMAVVRHLESVATCPELRAAYNAVQPEVSAFYSGIPLDSALWAAIKSYAATREGQALAGIRKRFLTKTMDTFRRHGAELDEPGKRRMEAIDVELTTLTTRFAEHVLDSTNEFDLVVKDGKRLAGLPPSALAVASQSAAGKGLEGWRFTLQAPSYVAVMTYLDDAAVREQFYRALNSRATAPPFDNRPILSRVIELRAEKAGLLGYGDFADFALEDRMARTGGRAQEFLEVLREKTERRFREENQELLEFRRSLEGPDASPLAPWDIAYYAEKQRAALYEFDEEALRPYFPLERVVDGMFGAAGRLFGIRVTPRDGVPAWHPDVRFFDVHDEGTGEFLGGFYADWHPRETKRGGAWMDGLITGVPGPEGMEPHLGLICGNLTPPVEGKPALLTHREVETIFHEFGHLLHHTLSRVPLRSLAGTNVPWDFVELPSQIMENWCWEREALDLFARHCETGETIPGELFERMKRARNFRAANGQMRQLGFGYADLALHRSQLTPGADVIDYTRRIFERFSPAPLPEDHAMIASFSHLFSSPVGYAAGYYSYKWAEVLDADAFTRFKQNGIFDRRTGMEFRDRILSRGDSEDPGDLYRSFMGRDPDPSALLARLGL